MTDDDPTPLEEDAIEAPPHRGVDGRKGCLLALVGSVVLGGASIGLSYYLLQLRNAPVLEATKELADIMNAAQAAPGASALRDAGCDGAGVFELPALETIAQRLEDARAKKEKRPTRPIDLGSEHRVVACTMKRQGSPTCEELAKRYVADAKPKGTFTVDIVNLNGEVCAEEYLESGERVGPTKSPNLPPLVTPD